MDNLEVLFSANFRYLKEQDCMPAEFLGKYLKFLLLHHD